MQTNLPWHHGSWLLSLNESGVGCVEVKSPQGGPTHKAGFTLGKKKF
jgi:hypothetical protein